MKALHSYPWFLAKFAALFFSLQIAVLQIEGTAMQRLLVDQATVAVAAFTLSKLFSDDQVSSQGPTVSSNRVRLNVLRGCEGWELFCLMAAAVLCLPIRWPARLRTLLLGLAVAYALNQMRIILLYWTVRDATALFDLVHGYLAPTLLLLIAVSFLFYEGRAQIEADSR